MKFLPLTIINLCIITACTTQQDTIIKQFDNDVSLVKNAQGEVMFRSKGMADCPKKYLYSKYGRDVSNFVSGSTDEPPQHALTNVIDINSLKLNENISNQYYFEDSHHTYLVLLTICDNTVSYQDKIQ